jgi:hypothetical protein
MIKIILHLCADIGSDSLYYQLDNEYEVIKIGKDIGVENYNPPENVYGVIANPVCTEFSTAKGFHLNNDMNKGMFLVNHCKRIIEECSPKFWAIENPFNGRLKDVLGKPDYTYEPWNFGSPWSKKTALWGCFNKPNYVYSHWDNVPKNPKLYVRPGRGKPSLAFLHKSAIDSIEEFKFFKDKINCDADFRSLCSQGFAKSFYEVNK